MRAIRRKVLAVCMAALLLTPSLAAIAEEMPEAGNADAAEIAAAVSGGDAAVETENAEDAVAVEATLVEEQIMAYADGDIASGTDGGITWVIDAGGKLTVEGTGDLSGVHSSANFAWRPYSSQITSAEINVSGIVNASFLFYGCENMVNMDVSGFDTSSVTNMKGMFWGCSSLTSLDVSGFATGNVTDMGTMFLGCSSLTSLDVSGFATGNVTNMEAMFWGCSSLTSLDVSGFNTGNVEDMGLMFHECSSLTSLDVSGFDTGNVTNMNAMFTGCSGLTSLDVGGFDTSNVTNMETMFWRCSSLTSLDVSGFATDNVTNMGSMFSGCSSLTSLDVSGFATDNVTNMGSMFSFCISLPSLDVSGFATSNVTDMSFMFSACDNLASLDLSGFDTSKVTDMSCMFQRCLKITSLDLSGFDTSNVVSMFAMFAGCRGLTSLNVGGFDTSNVTIMREMFIHCSSLTSLDVSGFDTGNVTNMAWMFKGCSSLASLDISNFDAANVVEDSTYPGGMKDIFSECTNLTMLHSPYNVAVTAMLPVVRDLTWHLPDGMEVTELPKDLSYSVTLTRSDVPSTPQITTTTPDLNMADVVRVKYVPYSYTVQTNADEEDTVTFSIEEGRLADGLQMYPATGEIYGVPLEAGEFKIKVKATYSNPEYPPAYAELTLTVLDNTDANVGVASDPGYEITQPVVDFAMGAMPGDGTQTLVSQGEYSQFRDVYIDGRKLAAGQDYTSASGSTRITILNQTLADGGAGTHTLGIEFRTEDGTLKRAAQNYVISSTSVSTPNNGSNSGNNNSGSNSTIFPASTESSQSDFLIYTVKRGDSLWKIAARFYGQGSSWRVIYEDNVAVIKNPGRLYAGQKLVIRLAGTAAAGYAPEAPVPTPNTVPLEGTAYRVQRGDRLWSIAQRAYDSGRLWTIIYEANKDIIANPERIREGQVIAIPQRR